MSTFPRDLIWLLSLTGAGLLGAAVFLGMPQLDIRVARLFADGADGFPMARNVVPNAIDAAVKIYSYLAPALILVGLIVTGFGRRRLMGVSLRGYGFLMSTFLLGPILTANVLLKNHWGRARPREITDFGGSADFTPALLITDQCDTNCSFVSGDASFAFWTVAVALVLPRWRAEFVKAALGFGMLIGLNRMVQGAHFLSDVVFAAIFMLLIVVSFKIILLDARWTPRACS